MYANAGYNASWLYNSEDDDNVDNDGQLSLDSDASEDSAQELRDAEELLYSHLHYEPNYLCKTGSLDYSNCLDVQITQLVDGVSDRLDYDIPGTTSKQEISDQKNNVDDEVVILDAQKPQGEVAHNTAVTINSVAEQLKRKSTSCETSESADEIKIKYKKVDAPSPSSVALDATAAESSRSPKLLDDAAGKQVAKNQTKKKLKAKRRRGLNHVPAAVDTSDLIVLDSISVSSSSSSSSSDAFCCDLSSEELPSDEADDIKLSNINVDLRQTSDSEALIEVLNSLPDGNWDVNAQDRATGTPGISRYYTQQTSRARCLNCHERGHLARDCTLPKKLLACILCGVRGHLSRSCPDSLCFNCHRPGHAVRDCDRHRIRNETCRRCRMRGHIEMDCPDLWRQYHMTTKPGQIMTSKSKKLERKFCYNCGASGHYGHECDEERMDGFSLPTLPFIARYDTHNAVTSRSIPHYRKQDRSNSDIRKHKRDSSFPRHTQRAREDKRHNRNRQKLCEKDSIGIPNNDLLRMEGSSHNVSAFNRRKGKHDRQYLPKDSRGSKHWQHSSANVTDGRYSDTINGKQFASHQPRSPHRRSSSAGSRSEQLLSRTKDTDSSVYRDNSRNSVLKYKIEKKSLQVKSLLNDTYYQHSREEARDHMKTPVHVKQLMSSGAKFKKKTLPPTTKHDEFSNKVVVSSKDKNRKVVKTARGFFMTVDSC